jgi:hypothetical protein
VTVVETGHFAAAAHHAGFRSVTAVTNLVHRGNERGLDALTIAAGRGRPPTEDASVPAQIVRVAPVPPDRRTDQTATGSRATATAARVRARRHCQTADALSPGDGRRAGHRGDAHHECPPPSVAASGTDRDPCDVARRAPSGYCAAKEEKFFGWRLHLIVTPQGVPVSFDLLPASLHDLTPLHELAERLPSGAWLYGDKADNSADNEAMLEGETGVRLVPIRKANMVPNPIDERVGLQRYRKQIEGVNSQWAAWGVQRLHARTNAGFMLKVWASLFALLCMNAC